MMSHLPGQKYRSLVSNKPSGNPDQLVIGLGNERGELQQNFCQQNSPGKKQKTEKIRKDNSLRGNLVKRAHCAQAQLFVINLLERTLTRVFST